MYYFFLNVTLLQAVKSAAHVSDHVNTRMHMCPSGTRQTYNHLAIKFLKLYLAFC